MSWPSLDTWRQSLFDAEDIIAMKPLNKKHSVWLVKYQGRQLVYKHTPEKSSRYNQGLATNSFQSIRGRQSRPLRVYVPQIVAPLGDATINQNGTDIGYNAFLMDYHPGDVCSGPFRC